jgi:maleylacetoacetate isomerase
VKLYTYWRSTSSYRLRIALALKGLEPKTEFIHLVRNGGEQNTARYRAINPQGRVPTLVLDDGTVLPQSPAIIEYLDEMYPTPPLLPVGPVERAKVRAVAAIIACDVHPLNNVSPLIWLRQVFGGSDQQVHDWIENWIGQGFSAIEAMIGTSGYCFGSSPGLADIYLLPQIYSARRFGISPDACPNILRVEELASAHPAFRKAHPSSQPDTE